MINVAMLVLSAVLRKDFDWSGCVMFSRDSRDVCPAFIFRAALQMLNTAVTVW